MENGVRITYPVKAVLKIFDFCMASKMTIVSDVKYLHILAATYNRECNFYISFSMSIVFYDAGHHVFPQIVNILAPTIACLLLFLSIHDLLSFYAKPLDKLLDVSVCLSCFPWV